jgi:hypothetical protein
MSASCGDMPTSTWRTSTTRDRTKGIDQHVSCGSPKMGEVACRIYEAQQSLASGHSWCFDRSGTWGFTDPNPVRQIQRPI